jgi:hypothetical protein
VGNQPDQRSLLSMDQRNVSRAQGKTEEQGEEKGKKHPRQNHRTPRTTDVPHSLDNFFKNQPKNRPLSHIYSIFRQIPRSLRHMTNRRPYPQGGAEIQRRASPRRARPSPHPPPAPGRSGASHVHAPLQADFSGARRRQGPFRVTTADNAKGTG